MMRYLPILIIRAAVGYPEFSSFCKVKHNYGYCLLLFMDAINIWEGPVSTIWIYGLTNRPGRCDNNFEMNNCRTYYKEY